MPPANRSHASGPAGAALRADLDAALTRLQAEGPLLLAVSGGADSVALLKLAAGGPRAVIVATVDHGLRREAAREAAGVAALCASLGLPHRLLRWTKAAAGSALMERARAARYALLAECAVRDGCAAIVTAHTADDQAETVFMRLARGSGPSGLKAMAFETQIACGAGAPVRLLRPLLGVRRAALRAFAEGEAAAFYDDPSNDDPQFERVRVRALLGALEGQSILTVEALCETARRLLAAERAAAAAEVAAFRQAEGWISRYGAFVLNAGAASATAPKLAARLIHAVSGEEHPPDPEAAEAALTSAMASGAATLGGALVRRRESALWFMREPAALLGRGAAKSPDIVSIEPGRSLVWDGRFILSNGGEAPADAQALGVSGLTALGPRRAFFAAPDEALITAPSAVFAESPLSVRSLLEERFFAPVLRFPKV